LNKQIKQRLVGAVVLVSLAVIFIPMLLDGGNNSSMPRFGSNVPHQPELDFEPLEIPLQPIEPIPEERPRVIHKAEEPQAPAAEAEQAKEAEAPKPAETVQAKPAVSSEQKPATQQAPIAWVVQVGSFGQSDNAMALRDKLRQNGFTAFVEKYRDNGKTSYRVRVGPELKRETAEKRLAQLKQKLQLKGIIMGHP
jgi:DedD protein